MTTTGEGLETLTRLAEKEYPGKVIGVCLFANRGIDEEIVSKVKNNYNFHSIIDLKLSSWSKSECNKKCLKKHLIKSKNINHLPIYSEEDEYERYIKKLDLVA